MSRQLNSDDNDRHFGTNSQNEALASAIENRDRFLEQNPNLVSYQEEIDQMLDKAGGSKQRMAVLGFMMEAKLDELRRHLMTLSEIVQPPPESGN